MDISMRTLHAPVRLHGVHAHVHAHMHVSAWQTAPTVVLPARGHDQEHARQIALAGGRVPSPHGISPLRQLARSTHNSRMLMHTRAARAAERADRHTYIGA